MTSAIELRHWLHQNPELSHQEFKTTDMLEQSIRSISSDLSILKPLQTGLLVEYTGKSKEYIMIRADIDALPILENSGADFSSQNQNMHACGHDIHSAILYQLIQEMVKFKSPQSLLFLFQPGEEMGGGAKQILDSGMLDHYEISSAMSLHVTDEYPFGFTAINQRSLFSASCEIDIIWQGLESHITMPEKGQNSLRALYRLLNWVEKSQSSKVFFGIGHINAGSVRNITPAKAFLQGTLRADTKTDIDQFLRDINSFLDSDQNRTGIPYQIKLGSRYPEVSVDRSLYNTFIEKIRSVAPVIECETKRTADDFGYFSMRFPSLMFWLGTQKGGKEVGLHHPSFCPDDSIIEIGSKIWMSMLK